MSMEDTTWYVVDDTPEKYMPELAKLLCVVHIHTYDDFALFNQTLKEHSMIAYKDSYRRLFKRYPSKQYDPMTAKDYAANVKEDCMYRIVWCKTNNPLGETGFQDESSKARVILWIMLNHAFLAQRSAGYSVYLVDESDGLNETIWNWQADDKDMCFGKLFRRGFPFMIHLVGGELRVYQDVISVATDDPVTLEPDEFASLMADI